MGVHEVIDIALIVITTILSLLSLIVLIRSMLDDLVKKSIYEFNVLNEGLCFKTSDYSRSCHSIGSIDIHPNTKIDIVSSDETGKEVYSWSHNKGKRNPSSGPSKDSANISAP